MLVVFCARAVARASKNVPARAIARAGACILCLSGSEGIEYIEKHWNPKFFYITNFIFSIIDMGSV